MGGCPSLLDHRWIFSSQTSQLFHFPMTWILRGIPRRRSGIGRAAPRGAAWIPHEYLPVPRPGRAHVPASPPRDASASGFRAARGGGPHTGIAIVAVRVDRTVEGGVNRWSLRTCLLSLSLSPFVTPPEKALRCVHPWKGTERGKKSCSERRGHRRLRRRRARRFIPSPIRSSPGLLLLHPRRGQYLEPPREVSLTADRLSCRAEWSAYRIPTPTRRRRSSSCRILFTAVCG